MSTTSPLFNDPNSDVVLQSSDGVNFHVDLAVLMKASPIFQDMTTLPTPSLQDNKEGRPIISLQDTSSTLELVLQIIYPNMHPSSEQVTDLGTYSAVLRAAEKYDMPKVTLVLSSILDDRRFFDTAENGLHVFALAGRYNMPLLARSAARALLAFPPPYERKDIPELEGVPATAYHKLLNYRLRCVELLFWYMGATSSSQWVGIWWDVTYRASWGSPMPSWANSNCNHCGRAMPQWFCDHVERIKEAYTRKVTVESVASAELLRPTIQAAQKTTRCGCHVTAAVDLLRFSAMLSEIVEKGLDGIEY